MTAPPSRPRVVTAAFWCWVLASILLVLFGVLLALSRADNAVFFRGAGVLLALAGVALGYLAGRARVGHPAFRRAAVALSLVIAVLLAMFTVVSHGLVWLLIMILATVGAVVIMRPSAQRWFESQEPQ